MSLSHRGERLSPRADGPCSRRAASNPLRRCAATDCRSERAWRQSCPRSRHVPARAQSAWRDRRRFRPSAVRLHPGDPRHLARNHPGDGDGEHPVVLPHDGRRFGSSRAATHPGVPCPFRRGRARPPQRRTPTSARSTSGAAIRRVKGSTARGSRNTYSRSTTSPCPARRVSRRTRDKPSRPTSARCVRATS